MHFLFGNSPLQNCPLRVLNDRFISLPRINGKVSAGSSYPSAELCIVTLLWFISRSMEVSSAGE